MAYSTLNLYHSRDGFTLVKEMGRSYFKDWVAGVADILCELTGHRKCHWFGRVLDWSEKNVKTDKRIPISDELALAVSDKEDWSWIWEEE